MNLLRIYQLLRNTLKMQKINEERARWSETNSGIIDSSHITLLLLERTQVSIVAYSQVFDGLGDL